MRFNLIAIPIIVLIIGCEIEQSTVNSSPIAISTVTRADAESRYAKHCMKADTISEPLLKEFNEMPVDRIDGFANGCESQERNKKRTK